MNSIKKVLKNTLSGLIKDEWEDNGKHNMLIHTSDYFTRERWLKNIREQLHDNIDNFEVKFTKDRITFYKLSQNANIIFSFSINHDIVNNNRTLRMYYVGLRGLDNLSDNNLPDTCNYYNIPPLGKRFIAEYALMVSIILCRRFKYSFYNQAKKKWNQNNLLHSEVSSVKEKVIGIAGIGNIGTEIANLFSGIGCPVLGWDKSENINSNIFQKVYNYTELDLFLSSIDILIITLPLTRQTDNLFNVDKLIKLKKGSMLINISRGKIVNENDLIYALENGRLGGAALDVFINEPLPKNNKLWNLSNVIISPHIAGNINYFVDEIQIDFLEKVKKEYSI